MLVNFSDKSVQDRITRSLVVRHVRQPANTLLSGCRLWAVDVSLGDYGHR